MTPPERAPTVAHAHDRIDPPLSVSPPPEGRLEALEPIRERLYAASSVVLTTHVNPDGDGLGSMVALSGRLRGAGVEATIVTPSRPPSSLAFVIRDTDVLVAEEPAARDVLDRAGVIAVLDTAEPKRLGAIAGDLERVGGVLIDHHPPVGPAVVEPAIRDPSACATGELVFDLLALDGDPLTRAEADALYVAIVTDTGSFQFSNTGPRTHEIAAHLLDLGVDAEAMYRELYSVYTKGRLALIRRGLESLEVDPRAPIAWIAIDHRALTDTGARGEDMEGLVDFPRRLRGMEVGILFRGLAADRTKVSLRSNGDVDVGRVAEALGGGGHAKASGAVLESGLEASIRTVLDVLRPRVEEVVAPASEG